jgi:hypothetical protein
MRNTLYSVDYELFGNGQGDLVRDLIRPTNRLLKIFKNLDVKGIFYIEGLEFAKLEGIGEDVDGVRNQVKEIYRQGHEIGLHIHPQWLVEDGCIRSRELNFDYWYTNSETMTSRLIEEAISTSLNFIYSCVPDIQLSKFRAGAFASSPSKFLGPILKNYGICTDSSIVPGYYTNKFGEVDFRDCAASESQVYEVDELDFRKKKSGSKFYEIQVGSFSFPAVFSLSMNVVYLKLFRSNSLPKNTAQKVKLKSSRPIDFGTMNILSFYYALKAYYRRGYLPTFITHPKALTFFGNVYVNIYMIKLFDEKV